MHQSIAWTCHYPEQKDGSSVCTVVIAIGTKNQLVSNSTHSEGAETALECVKVELLSSGGEKLHWQVAFAQTST